MFAFFQVVFTVGAPLRDGIADGLNWLGAQIAEHMGNSLAGSLLGHAVIGGVGTVLQFIPQIALLFLLIALLENLGYLARAAFVMDRVMATTGLEGRALSRCCRRLPAPSPALWRPGRCRRRATGSPPS